MKDLVAYGLFIATFKDLSPSQKPGSFSIDQALQALIEAVAGLGSN
jgi:hypothetical protein